MPLPLLGMAVRGLVGGGGRSAVAKSAGRNIPRTSAKRAGRRSTGRSRSSLLSPPPPPSFDSEDSGSGDSSGLMKSNVSSLLALVNLAKKSDSSVVVHAKQFAITGDIKNSIINVMNPKNMVTGTSTSTSGGVKAIKSETREKSLERKRRRIVPERISRGFQTAKDKGGGLLATLLQVAFIGTLVSAMAPLVIKFIGGFLREKFKENYVEIVKFGAKALDGLKTLSMMASDALMGLGATIVKGVLNFMPNIVSGLISIVETVLLKPIEGLAEFFGISADLTQFSTRLKSSISSMTTLTDNLVDSGFNLFKFGDEGTKAREDLFGAINSIGTSILSSDTGQTVIESGIKLATLPDKVVDAAPEVAGGFSKLISETGRVLNPFNETSIFQQTYRAVTTGDRNLQPARPSEATLNTNQAPSPNQMQSTPPIIIPIQQQASAQGGSNNSIEYVPNTRTGTQNELRDAIFDNGSGKNVATI